jgi:hypothetical protein
MKELILKTAAILLIGYFLVSFSRTRISPPMILAQNNVLQFTVTGNGENLPASPGAVAASNYVLPYPGILLDHPLYFLKNWRDQMLERVISDPVKKTEFYLLQSDKFLAMAIAFAEKGQWPNVITALERSNQFVEKTTASLAAKPELPGHLGVKARESQAKHLEVIAGFMTRASESQIISKLSQIKEQIQSRTGN